MNRLLQIVGLAAITFGALFFLQGAGIVRWPASSFMVDLRIWMLWGGLIAAAGALAVWLGRRR